LISLDHHPRMESFNFSNTPHFANPGGNVSNMILNNDGTIANVNNFSSVTGVTNLGRDGIDERQFPFGLKLRFYFQDPSGEDLATKVDF
jgi:hypothetical protein